VEPGHLINHAFAILKGAIQNPDSSRIIVREFV
jgi:hypothetical protein